MSKEPLSKNYHIDISAGDTPETCVVSVKDQDGKRLKEWLVKDYSLLENRLKLATLYLKKISA